MNNWKLTRTNNGKNSHRFCRTVHTCTPFLTKQQQNRRNQCTRVTNTDPPNEVCDVVAPVDCSVQVPRTNTFPDCPSYRKEIQRQKSYCNCKCSHPCLARNSFRRRTDVFCYLMIGFIARNQRLSNARNNYAHFI